MKLGRDFYLRPANECVKEFLGKKLVLDSPLGRMAGVIFDVESYPAFADEVHHGNKRTSRTDVMYGEGGFAYVYLIYGTWYQFAVVVNKADIPDVVFIRGVLPRLGIPTMRKNFGRHVPDPIELANSPGKLCKSFGITKQMYGTDLTGDTLWLEDIGLEVSPGAIRQMKRVGISPKYKGATAELRFRVPPKLLWSAPNRSNS